MTIKQRQMALVYRLIEKIWGSGVLMQFVDIVEGEE
jgi:hypothetical protein